MHCKMAGCPTSKAMVERLLAFLRGQLQRTSNPFKLHILQGDIAMFERKNR